MRFVGGPTSRSLWVSVAFFMVCPLTFLKTLDALKVTSTLALVFVGMVGVIIVAFGLGFPGLDIPCEPAVVPEAPAPDVSADDAACDAPVLYPMTDFLRTVYVTFRLNFNHFDRLELDLRGHMHVRGAAFSWSRLKLADIVLI